MTRTETPARTPRRCRTASLLALFAATAALSGGQALTPSPATATMQEGGECSTSDFWEWWACEENGGGGGNGQAAPPEAPDDCESPSDCWWNPDATETSQPQPDTERPRNIADQSEQEWWEQRDRGWADHCLRLVGQISHDRDEIERLSHELGYADQDVDRQWRSSLRASRRRQRLSLWADYRQFGQDNCEPYIAGRD